MAFIHNHLGNLYWQQRLVQQSIDHHEQAIEIRSKIGDGALLADSYNNLGAIYLKNKQWDLSQENLEKALELYQQNYDNTHPYIAHALQNLAIVAENKHEWDKAQKLHNRSLASFLKSYDKSHIKILLTQTNLSIFYRKLEQYQKSIELLKQIIKTYLEQGNTRSVIKQSRRLARIYRESGDLELSVKQYIYTLNLTKNSDWNLENIHAKLMIEMAQTYLLQKAHAKAQEALKKGEQILKSDKVLDDYYFHLKRLNISALVFIDLKEYDQAIAAYKNVIALSNTDDTDNQKHVIYAYLGLGDILTTLTDYQTGNENYAMALKLSEKIYPYNHKTNAKIFYQRALLELAQNNHKKAKHNLNKALEIQTSILPKKHSELIQTQEQLKSLNL